MIRPLVVASLLLALSPCLAQSPTPTPPPGSTRGIPLPPAPARVGFVDIELVIENSAALRKALDAIDKTLAADQRRIQELEAQFRRERFDLDRQDRVLSPISRDERRAALSALQEDIDRKRFDLDQELRSRERQIEPVLELIMTVVAEVARRDGYDVILRGEVVIYGQPSADLTDRIISELDARADEVIAVFNRGAAGRALKTDDTETTAPIRPVATPRDYREVMPMVP